MSFGFTWKPVEKIHQFTMVSSPISTLENVLTPIVAGACQFDLSKLDPLTIGIRSIYFRIVAASTSVSKSTTVSLYDLGAVTGSVGIITNSTLTSTSLTPHFYQVDLTSQLNSGNAGVLQVQLSLTNAATGHIGTLYTAKIEVEW